MNDQTLDWLPVKAQGSVLGPLLFLIYLNNLPIKLFKDDMSLFPTCI